MKKGKMRGKNVLAATLGLSLFLSPFGNVSNVFAKETDNAGITVSAAEESEAAAIKASADDGEVSAAAASGQADIEQGLKSSLENGAQTGSVEKSSDALSRDSSKATSSNTSSTDSSESTSSDMSSADSSVVKSSNASSLDESAESSSNLTSADGSSKESSEASSLGSSLDDEYSLTAATGASTYSVSEAELPSNAAPREQKAADNSLITKEYVHDGAILHAFCWSFNTIAENMADIKAAGYTAVQTSPINECLDTDSGKNLHGPDGMWYYHYQPTDWVIGNYQLGSRDEFKHMCDVADEYGIAVIVDILPNHTTVSADYVSDALKEAVGGVENLYHTTGKTAGGYVDRLELTYYEMGGLPDVDTENIEFQEYFYEFLKDCVYLGADGFRIDTAKHISLPDDPVPGDYAGNEDRNSFYPNMKEALDEYSEEVGTKSYDELFVYGEVLQGTNDRLASYQEYIGGTTASNYGGSIRSALSSKDLTASRITDYQIYDETIGDRTYTADTEKLVTWVESHDNYMNDSENSWKTIDDKQLILGWAYIAARKDGTPLFFSRPNNSSAENPYGDNLIGEAGSDIYKAPEVKAVNLFRQKMQNADEVISNPGGNVQTIMVERKGSDVQGAVIINESSQTATISAGTVLEDGVYYDQVEGSNNTFLVKDGVLYGAVSAMSVVVLTDRTEGAGTVVSFYNSQSWDSVVARVDGSDETIATINDNDGWYWVTVLDEEFSIVFENADKSAVSPVYEIGNGSGTFVTAEDSTLYFSKEEAEKGIGIHTYPVYFFNTEGWDTVNVYGWLYGGEQLFGGWPGMSAQNEGAGWWKASVKTKSEISDFSVIFNNGEGKQTVNIEGITPDDKDIYFAVDAENSGDQLVVKRYSDKSSAEEELGVSGSFTTVYFYNTEGWDKVCVYTWGATSFGEWPGQELSQEADGWYKVVLPAGAGDDLNIIFNNGNNGKQTSDMKISDMKYRYILHNGITYQKYGTKKEALAEISTGEDVSYTTVYFYNENADDSSWENVALYVYGGNSGEYNNLVGDWPGKVMKREEGTNWYSAEVPTKAINTGTLTYIFNNNNNGQQLSDNRNITSDKNYFVTSSTDSFASKEDVYDFLGYNPENKEPEGEFVTRWGVTSFVTTDGKKLTGLNTIKGNTYFFKENGAMVKSNYVTIDGDTYYFKSDGTMTTGFMTKWGVTYYFYENGIQAKDTLVNDNGYTYYFKANGAMVKSSFVTMDDGKHYFNADGHMVVSATMTKWGVKYTFDENGVLIK